MIAKLHRLSRDAHFPLGLEKAGVEAAADMPHANRLTVGIMAMVADEERRMVSKRTKDALAAAKARGIRLGSGRGNLPAVSVEGRAVSIPVRRAKADRHVADLAPIIADIQAEGAMSLSKIAAILNSERFKAKRGGKWSPAQVERLLNQMHSLIEVG